MVCPAKGWTINLGAAGILHQCCGETTTCECTLPSECSRFRSPLLPALDALCPGARRRASEIYSFFKRWLG
ncbi:hypothetical protein PISMIDRAFT_260129 [Pisolithus microcarpus 441]|uniref:Uncharacterized protein n=1 Tax=Pisolithus microcarpus 441 TaxID=765257 RepID=A0A0C9ZWF5_9AGAM|nr:hypothetical protein PISMIDRAFT_260129 [Pisolithus microcarpus 441]